MVHSKMLKLRAKELGITQKDMAAALGLRQATVSQKLNNDRPMTLQEAEKLAQMLGIRGEEFTQYFFAWEQREGNITPEEWSLIEKYRLLPRSHQLLMHALMMSPEQKR